ncbi:molybdenum cofactor sulfurase [Drosophila rhopaloa]|uniref:Molybdenum cofactor sulfurase n=1 Tax=Drosophila rhopaloa TaxID=1041015 RepID=A0A6P4F9C8_DRORH|nr:molybdenum cofactor sulfurase [Drosophila rhopaloa]
MSPYRPEFSPSEQSKIDVEFSRLANNKSVYLDHAGTTLYAENQVKAAAEQLHRNVICNPHTCRLTGDFVDQVRFKVLEFFNTSAEDYHVIFTANATAALSLVAENFDFGSSGDFHFCQENHTSVLGMRERVRANGIYMLKENEISGGFANENGRVQERTSTITGNSLVTFSAQCNFSGYKIPLVAIENIQNYGLPKPGKHIWGSKGEEKDNSQNNYYVCLDAASFVATSPLDLYKYQPDYVCISFYKIFGYPTGVGALLVSRRGAEAFGKRRFFGGGTINYAYPHAMDHQLRETFHQRYEDGTLPFLSIVGLLEGFRTLNRLVPRTSAVVGTMERISRHVHGLAQYLEDQLKQLKHSNGEPLIQLYNKVGYQEKSRQGGIVAFNVRTESGSFVGFGEIACVAALHGILLRTGCFCNIGACQFYLDLDEDAMDAIYKRAGRICGDYFDLIDGQPTGAVRVSFGYMTTIQDVEKLLEMLRSSYLATKPQQRIQFIEDQAEQLPPVLKERVQMLRPKLLQMAIYPVKSCAAFKIESQGSWPLTEQGLKYDREWMIVDMNGMALTQKRCTELCLIRPVIKVDQLELQFGDGSSVSVPLSVEDQAADSAKCVSKVCRQPVEGLDCGEEVAQWLCQCLGLEGLRLLRQSGQRNSSKDQQKLSLVNQAQFLLLNRSSVRSLQFEEPLDETVDRFRANIIIDTGCAFEELAYTALTIGGIHFQVEGPCQRCDMICINQRTGERSPETLTTISRLQSGRMRFGIYITRITKDLEAQENHMTCGDVVLVE